jgi:MtN3 and saliva related transmembrane protein
MEAVAVLGMIAFALTCLIQAPQAIKVIRTGKTRDISLATYGLMWLASFVWIVYGILKHDVAVAAANFVVIGLASIVLAYKVQQNKL